MSRLSLSGCVLLVLLPAGVARAELVCTEPIHDAGSISSGTPLTHRFTLVNRGQAVIEVTAVKPGCSCLRPRLEQPTIGPGGQSAFALDVNTLTQASGPNLWRAVVHYHENGKAETLAVHVRANVTAVVSVQPASLLLHTQTAARGTFTLTEHLPAPLAITSLSTASPHIRATCGPAVREGDAWKRTISLEVQGSMPEGRHDDILKILTNDPRYGELTAPFIVIKRSPDRVQASPASLALVAYANAPVASRIVMLDVRDDKPVMVQRVESSHPFLHCTWSSGPGARATLRILFDSAQMPAEKNFDGEVRVYILEPLAQVVTIPVHCVRP